MPEGHTLRRLADELTEVFAGRRVWVSSPNGRFAADAEQIDGTVAIGAESAGKHLFIEFANDRFVHVHLGLIGRFDVTAEAAQAPEPVGEVRFRLTARDGRGTSYADLRGAIVVDLVGAARRHEVLSRLGPDPVRPGVDASPFVDRVRRSSRPIADLLLDQEVIAGVGNVYRAEVLFRQRIHPLRPGRTLRRGQLDAIWADLVDLMAAGVRTGRIDTVRPEHLPEAMGRAPRSDRRGGEVYVYRRAAQPCLVCARPVRADVLAGRNLFWCGHCQRAYRSRALQ